MSQAITIQLSDQVYQQLMLAASRFQLPTEAIIQNSLKHTLPPLFQEIPEEYQGDVFPLLAMDDRELQQEVQRTFAPARWEQYENLLERKKNMPLTEQEQQNLAQLRREADVLTFRRSYAAVLLKRRDYPLPPLP
jgi:hypothetical protein